MKRSIGPIVVAAAILFAPVAVTEPAQAKAPGPNGQIVFERFNHSLGHNVIYTANPDGSHQQLLYLGGAFPNWSPDGSQVLFGTACFDGTETCAATIVDVDSGTFRQLRWPDPTLETDCTGRWSPDGQLLVCSGFGVTDPSRNGIYTIRSSDGRGLTRITSNLGGEDEGGEFSPDGKRIVFIRVNQSGPVGLFVVRLDGSGLRRITPPGFLPGNLSRDEQSVSWSPSGNKILFVSRIDPSHRFAIWVVHPDGSGLHQVPIMPACGGAFSDPRSFSCFQPSWSPDGTKIIFTGRTANGTQQNIYTVNADGSGLTQVTNSAGGPYQDADWGPHPLAT